MKLILHFFRIWGNTYCMECISLNERGRQWTQQRWIKGLLKDVNSPVTRVGLSVTIIFFFFCVYIVEVRVRANMQRTARGA